MDEESRSPVPDLTVSDETDQQRRRAYELALARAQARQRAEQRRRATWPAMIKALLVVVGIVFALLLLVPRVNGVTQPPVDVQAGSRAAALAVAFTPSVPTGLPRQWRATSVRTTATTDGVLTWHAGYVVSEKRYVALEQAQDVTAGWIRTQTGGGAKDGTMSVGGLAWQRFRTTDGSTRALLRLSQTGAVRPLTTVVTGTAGYDELAVLAGSLRPLP